MKAPPDYLKDYVREPAPDGPADLLSDGSWCGHGEPEFAVYDIHEAGEGSLGVILPSGEPYPALCAVSALREGHKPFFIYDPRRHPASVYAGSSKEHPYVPAAPHRCSCGSRCFRVAVGFEIPGDSETPEDTSSFALAVQCTHCLKRERLFDDETA
jgi:hypothetical protein